MYLKVVEAEVLATTCHYCERVLKQGCRNEESFQAEVTESRGHCPVAGDLEVAPVCHEARCTSQGVHMSQLYLKI